MATGIIILVRLVLAHVITDFILQPNAWVKGKQERKHRSPYLYLHGFLTGIIAYLLLAQWNNVLIPVFIAVTHTVIDAWKLHKGDSLKYFLLDQLFHLLVLAAVWIYVQNDLNIVHTALMKVLESEKIMLLLLGFSIVIWPAGFIISKATERWRKEIAEATQANKDSLAKAGLYIGILERILVLIFVLIDQFEAVGFLIAAKSILRFSDKSEEKPRKQTEYVLIGTLLSFTITIILGLGIKYYLKL